VAIRNPWGQPAACRGALHPIGGGSESRIALSILTEYPYALRVSLYSIAGYGLPELYFASAVVGQYLRTLYPMLLVNFEQRIRCTAYHDLRGRNRFTRPQIFRYNVCLCCLPSPALPLSSAAILRCTVRQWPHLLSTNDQNAFIF
jgi:hypothetical protein